MSVDPGIELKGRVRGRGRASGRVSVKVTGRGRAGPVAVWPPGSPECATQAAMAENSVQLGGEEDIVG